VRARGTWWVNAALSCSPQLQQAFWALGWLLGQALLANRSTLGIRLAPLLCEHLLLAPGAELRVDTTKVQQHDPHAAASIEAACQLPHQQYLQLLEVEQLPPIMSRQAYAQHAAQQLLVAGVLWQVQAMRQGFAAVADRQVLADCCLDAASLAAAACGGSADAHFRVQDAFRIVLEDAGADDDAVAHTGGSSTTTTSFLVQCLWQVVDDRWCADKRAAFCKFVTGVARCVCLAALLSQLLVRPRSPTRLTAARSRQPQAAGAPRLGAAGAQLPIHCSRSAAAAADAGHTAPEPHVQVRCRRLTDG
jgi:hypothetical protein